ncbi:hypothetical protein BDW69DRAFT_61227 [Aspergillus filifer]
MGPKEPLTSSAAKSSPRQGLALATSGLFAGTTGEPRTTIASRLSTASAGTGCHSYRTRPQQTLNGSIISVLTLLSPGLQPPFGNRAPALGIPTLLASYDRPHTQRESM